MKSDPHSVFARGNPEICAHLPPTPAAQMGEAVHRAGEPLPSGCFLAAAGPELKVEPSWRVHEEKGTGTMPPGRGATP